MINQEQQVHVDSQELIEQNQEINGIKFKIGQSLSNSDNFKLINKTDDRFIFFLN